MKTIVSHESALGLDGAKVAAAVGVKESNIRVEVSAEYPIEKFVGPATKAVDSLLDKLEAAIPGDWDKPMIERLKQEYKADLVKMLSEQDAKEVVPA